MINCMLIHEVWEKAMLAPFAQHSFQLLTGEQVKSRLRIDRADPKTHCQRYCRRKGLLRETGELGVAQHRHEGGQVGERQERACAASQTQSNEHAHTVHELQEQGDLRS